MEIHFKIIGVLSAIVAGTHTFLPEYLSRKIGAENLSFENHQTVVIKNFITGIFAIFIAMDCLGHTKDLIEATYSKNTSLFFIICSIYQLKDHFFKPSSRLWKETRFKISVKIILIALWVYIVCVFCVNYFNLSN